MSLKYKNQYITGFKTKAKALKHKKEEYEFAHSTFFKSMNESMNKIILTEQVKLVKKISKKFKLDYNELYDLYIKKKKSKDMDEEDNLLTITDENESNENENENKSSDEEDERFENIMQQVQIQGKNYYVDIQNGGIIYDENIKKVGVYNGKQYKLFD